MYGGHIVETGPTLKRSSPTGTPVHRPPPVRRPRPRALDVDAAAARPTRPSSSTTPSRRFRTRCPLAVDSLPPRHSHACSRSARATPAAKPRHRGPPHDHAAVEPAAAAQQQRMAPPGAITARRPRLPGPARACQRTVQPTVSSALATALEQGRPGLARPALHAQSRGRIAVLYEPDPRAGHTSSASTSGAPGCARAVADLSGTIVSAPRCAQPRPGRHHGRQTPPWPAPNRPSPSRADARRRRPHRRGHPGVFDRHTGRVRYAVNLPGWAAPDSSSGCARASARALRPQRALSAWPHSASTPSARARAAALRLRPHRHRPRHGRRRRRRTLFLGAHGAAGEVGFLPLGGVPASGSAPRRGMLEDAVSADASGPHRPRPRHDRAHRQARLRRLTPAPATRPPAPPCARRANACSPSPSPLRHRRLDRPGGARRVGRADLLLSHGGRNPAPPHPAAAPVSRPARHGDDAVLLGALYDGPARRPAPWSSTAARRPRDGRRTGTHDAWRPVGTSPDRPPSLCPRGDLNPHAR